MTLIHYRAVDDQGCIVEESQDAASVDALGSVLESRGFTLISADETGRGIAIISFFS